MEVGWLAPVCLCLGACVSGGAAPREATGPELVAAARASGLALDDPMEITIEMRREIERAVAMGTSARSRLQQLAEHLLDRGGGFKEVQGLSLPVKRAYEERRGDCITYAMLFVALSRQLGLRTHFVHASEVLTYQERGSSLYAASHIAVGYPDPPDDIIIDFNQEYDEWRLLDYHRIDDAAAVALYFNNIAVYAMMAGRADEAEALLRFLIERHPDLAELHNNIIVVHLRKKNFDAALAAAHRGMARFPRYMPFFTNAIQAAHGAGQAAVARELEQRAKLIVGNDALFIFAQGLQHYQRAEYAIAAEHFDRAAAKRRDSIVMLAWRVRAHFAAGQAGAGREAFAVARKRAPNDPRVRDLVAQFPELRD